MTQSSSNITGPDDLYRVVDFALGDEPANASTQTFETAARFLADTLGCALVGSGASTNDAIRHAFSLQEGRYIIPGRTGRMSRDAVAVITAHAIHCLEWDAVHEPAVVHAMSVTTGALWTEVQDNAHVSGRDFLASIIVGVDIASRLGVATDSAVRFFRPATAGLLGATAAIARMRQMDKTQTANAMGLAYSQIQGTMQAHAEGTSALAIQVALSARAALNACDMAAAGLTGPHNILSGPFGYFTLVEDGGDIQKLLDGLGERFAIDELSIKPYPSGRASHGALSVLLKTIADGRVNKDNFSGLKAEVPPLIHRLVGRPYQPVMTEAYARLCLPYLVGLALEDGEINPRRFTPEDFGRNTIAAHATKVEVVIDDNPDLNALAPQSVSISLSNGETIHQEVPATLGSPENPVSNEELKQKFLLAASLSNTEPKHARQIFDALTSISTAPNARDVLRQLVPAHAP